ncbi:hypothetical protein J7U46_09525 [Pelomonas sp. V22]|uniref:hypothetical protein n=1 Tax=Pelomonas sp. V22 TaxID=2822139 RepID=UPI0024A9066B|nr:hypothetical protein [Pelomonas sp. V22]MDI4633285.1 hypothetical protein [Pelomonas sp. V22]
MTAPPPAPDRANRNTFSQLATDLAAFNKNTGVPEMQLAIDSAHTNAVSAYESAVNADSRATAAEASLQAALLALAAPKWNAATNYAVGDTAWSPINGLSYRRLIAGTTATDPSADATNWVVIPQTDFRTAAIAGANRWLRFSGSNGGNPVLDSTAGAPQINGGVVQHYSGVVQELGYLDMPIQSLSSSRNLAAADRSMALCKTSASVYTLTIQQDATLNLPIGFAFRVVNDSSTALNIAPSGSASLVRALTGSTGSRTVAAGGEAMVQKLAANRWRISGMGLT